MLPSLLSAVRSLYSVIIILYFDCFALVKYGYYCLIKPYKENVYDNLRSIHSNITDKEASAVLKKFYRYIIDTRHEFMLIRWLPKKQLLQMWHIENADILEKYYQENRSIVLMLSHFAGNTNMAILLALYTPHKVIGAYAPCPNKQAEQIKNIRSKYGGIPVPNHHLYKKTLCEPVSAPTCFVLFADQVPTPPYKYVTKFLGKDRYMKIGAEKIAQKNNYVVITVKASKQKRHHYKYELLVLSEHAATEPHLSVSRTFFRTLETQVQKHPELWLHLKNPSTRKVSYSGLTHTAPSLPKTSLAIDNGIRWLISFFLNF